MTREMKQIFTRRITQANSTQLVVILYDMILTYLKDAADAYDIGCEEEFKKDMQCARNCIAELRNSLNFSYDLSRTLRRRHHVAVSSLAIQGIQMSSSGILFRSIITVDVKMVVFFNACR